MKKNIKARCAALVVLMLSLTGAYAQQKKDSLVNVAFRTVAQKDLLGAVSTVNVAELLKKNYGTSSLDNLSRGHYGVELINSSGQVVFRKDLQIQVGYIDDYFYLPSTLSRGVYTLAVSPDGKERVYKRILVQ